MLKASNRPTLFITMTNESEIHEQAKEKRREFGKYQGNIDDVKGEQQRKVSPILCDVESNGAQEG